LRVKHGPNLENRENRDDDSDDNSDDNSDDDSEAVWEPTDDLFPEMNIRL